MEGKEEEEEREGKGENFQQESVKALFIHRNQVMFNKKSCIPVSPAICLVKLNHMQVWDGLHFQEVNHKQSSFPFDQRLGTCLVPRATQRHGLLAAHSQPIREMNPGETRSLEVAGAVQKANSVLHLSICVCDSNEDLSFPI